VWVSLIRFGSDQFRRVPQRLLSDGERWNRGSRRRTAGARAAQWAAVPASRVERPRRDADDFHGVGILLCHHQRRRDAPAAKVMRTLFPFAGLASKFLCHVLADCIGAAWTTSIVAAN